MWRMEHVRCIPPKFRSISDEQVRAKSPDFGKARWADEAFMSNLTRGSLNLSATYFQIFTSKGWKNYTKVAVDNGVQTDSC